MYRCGRRAGDEGKLAHLVAGGGRGKDRMEAKSLAANVLNRSKRVDAKSVERCAILG